MGILSSPDQTERHPQRLAAPRIERPTTKPCSAGKKKLRLHRKFGLAERGDNGGLAWRLGTFSRKNSSIVSANSRYVA